MGNGGMRTVQSTEEKEIIRRSCSHANSDKTPGNLMTNSPHRIRNFLAKSARGLLRKINLAGKQDQNSKWILF